MLMSAERWGEGRAARVMSALTLAIAVALGVFQIYTAISLNLDSYLQRVLHLMFVLTLVFILRPPAKRAWARGPVPAALDLLLVVASVTVTLYPVLMFDELVLRTGDPTGTDLLMGAVAIVLVMEATRRVIGLFMAVLVAIFVAYAWLGPLLPDVLAHRGYTYQRIIYHSYLFQEGIFGLPLGVAATFVFMFIFFGAVLEKTGGGAFFIDIAYALTGRYRGGPAKAAVLGSAFMGSVSGSAIANAVTTGTFTIPMMKRVGYRPHEAAGVEAAASTGGQLLPPIMGAGAFIMAELTGTPYSEIITIAIIPALMYFLVIFVFVDIIARRGGMSGMPADALPVLRSTIAAGWHFVIPFVLLIVLLLRQVSPLTAGLYATGALVAVAMARRLSRLDWRSAAEIFLLAARNAVGVSVACAAAGVIVGIVGLTGLGLKFSSLMVGVAGGSLLLTLIMVALASLVLGLGLPVTASYIVLVVLAGPALGDLGLPVIVAHMIVYWYSQDSNVTPPVALVAFAASGVAGASPMRSGLAAWKFAKGLYLIPIMMAYSPLLLNGGPLDVVMAVVTGTIGLLAFAIAIEGYWLRRTHIAERIAMAAATVLLLWPSEITRFIGAALVAVVVVSQWRLN